MTLNEIIYNVRERLKLSTDDTDVSNEYIAHLVGIKRVYLMKQRFSQFSRDIPEEVKQIVCLNLEVVDAIGGQECFGNILRSKESLPTLMDIGGRSALLSVRVGDITFPHLNVVPAERLPYVGTNKWLKKQVYVALDADKRLYLNSNNPQHFNLQSVKVVGVFTDPEEAEELSCEVRDESCEYFDKKYPIEPYLVSDLVNMIVQELAPTLGIPEDSVNNANDDRQQNPQS